MPLKFDQEDTTVRMKPEHVKYMKVTVGLLGISIGVVCIFAVVLGVSAYSIIQTTKPAVRSLTTGNLNRAISEAHLMMKSARHVTENTPIKEVLYNTNNILKHSGSLMNEISKWRKISSHALQTTSIMMKKHPEWSKDLKETVQSLQKTAEPLAIESKEWRKALRGASKAYAKTMINMFSP